MNKKRSINKISFIIIILCSSLFSCLPFPISDDEPPDPAGPAKPGFNDVESYYRQLFPEKRKTRYLGFKKNNDDYIMNDFDSDGIINTEDPYPLDVFFPGNIINSINIPLITSSSISEADFGIYTITGNKVLTLGTIGFSINDYLENFNKTNFSKVYTDAGSLANDTEQRIKIDFTDSKVLKLFIASLNNEYSTDNLLNDIIDSSDNCDRDYEQGSGLPNLSHESIINIGRIIELFAKKNDSDFSLETLAGELYTFLTGKEYENVPDFLDHFKKGDDPYLILGNPVCERFGLPSKNNESLWNYLSYDTVIFSSLCTNTSPGINCTELKNHIIFSPYLDFNHTDQFEENYSQYKIKFNSTSLDLDRMVAVKVLMERNNTAFGSDYTTKLFISGKDVVDLNDLDHTGEFIKFLDLSDSGFDITSGDEIIYDLEKDDGNFKEHIYKMFLDAAEDQGTDEKINRENYTFFFFLIPQAGAGDVVVNNTTEAFYTGQLQGDNFFDNYYFEVPDNETITNLKIDLECYGNDFDMFIQHTTCPTITNQIVSNYLDCGILEGNDSITIENPAAGTYCIVIEKWSGETFTLSTKMTIATTNPGNGNWTLIGSTAHFWPPPDRTTLVAKVDNSNNITEGPYVLPYEYLHDPERFISDGDLFYNDDSIYKLDLTSTKLRNLFTIDANNNEKLLFVQGAYGVTENHQPYITSYPEAQLFMADPENNYPLNDHILMLEEGGLPDTNKDNKVVNKFITDFNANAYLISFDHICKDTGNGTVELPIGNFYYNNNDPLDPIRNKVLLTIRGITQPTQPTNLACEVTEPETDKFNITLNWDFLNQYTNDKTLTHFTIERKMEGGEFTVIADEIDSSIRNYTDTTVRSNTTYDYRVAAVNCAGETESAIAQAATPQTKPAPPSGLTATAGSFARIQLTWTDNSHNETGFKLKRNDLADPITIEGANIIEYEDTYQLLPETLYTYTICSYNELGDSPESAQASAITLGSELPPEVAGISCDITFQNDIYGNADHWIPNTSELCRPFTITIEGRDVNKNVFEIPENLNIKPIAPIDPNWTEGAADVENSNIHRNKGTCNFRLYATDQDGNEQNYWLAEYNIAETAGNDTNEYWNITYNEVYFTEEGVPVGDCALNITDTGLLRFVVGGVPYTYFALRAEKDTGTIRPGDDILLRFGLSDYQEIVPATAGEGGFLAIYDKILLWRANLFVDEGVNDWNNVNPWNDPDNNDWQNYVDYNNNNTVTNSNGQQIPILSWTHPEHVHFRYDDDGNLTNIIDWMVTCRTVTSSVAYSWAASDTLFHFNNDVDDQRDAMNQEYDATHDQWPNWNNTTAPDNDWSNYLTTTYRPAYSILTHCNQTNPAESDLAEKAGDAYRSAGTDCCGFITRVVSYNNGNAYQVAVDNPDEREVFDDDGVNRPYIAIGGDDGFAALSWEIENINLLVPGDIVYMYTPGVHIAIINKITYTDEDERATTASNIHFIEATTWGLQWSVQNSQSANDYRNYVLHFSRLIP